MGRTFGPEESQFDRGGGGMNDECRMSNDELPDGWLRAPFSAVTVNPIQRVPSEKEEITYIDIGSVDRITKQVVEPQTMLGKDAPSRARKVIQTGDVLVSTVRPNLNAVALVESQYNGQFASTGFDVLRSPVVDPRWLFYSVRTPEFLDRMSELVQGALYPAVRSFDIRSFVIPIAPLAEQKRIADKLEAVLGRVDACRARLDRVPALLKRFRQSVLAAATSGKLTEEWRMSNGVSDEWESVTLGSLMDSKPRNGYSPKSVDFETPVRSLTLTATTSGKFRGEHSKFINEKIPHSSHLWLVPGDILIQRANTIEYVGVSAIFDGPPGKFIYPDLMMKCRANSRTTTGFLHLLLQSEPVRTYFRDNATGTAGNMPKINQGTVISAPTVLPTLPEQQEIVRRVEDLFAFADRIEARLATAQKTVERLTPATLAKAFRGELVPQDSSDEPAAALLARLRTQPVAKPAKATRKTLK